MFESSLLHYDRVIYFTRRRKFSIIVFKSFVYCDEFLWEKLKRKKIERNKTAKKLGSREVNASLENSTFVPREHCCCWHSSKRRNMFILYLTLDFLHRLQSEFSCSQRKIFLTIHNFRNSNSPAVKCRSRTFHIIRSVWGKKRELSRHPWGDRMTVESNEWPPRADRVKGEAGGGGRDGYCLVTSRFMIFYCPFLKYALRPYFGKMVSGHCLNS